METNIERQLIAHLLLDAEQYLLHATEIDKNLFSGHIERDIFQTYKKLVENNQEPDSFTISELIKARYKNAFIEISDIESINPYNSNINNLIAILRQRYQIKKLNQLGQQLAAIAPTEKPDKHIQSAAETLHHLQSITKQRKIKDFSYVVDELIDHIENQKTDEISGIATGLREYDIHTRGMQLQDLIIIGGETSQGKTALAISMIYNAVLNNNPVLFISLEMSQMQLAARTLAQHTRTGAKTLLLYKINDPRKTELIEKLQSAREFPYYIDDTCGNKYPNIINLIRRYVIQKNINIVVIDYIQLINYHRPGINKEQEIGDIARGLKNIAKELNIVIIALSQLSRNKDNPKPTLNRLRQSGQIEEAADVITFIYRPEYYDYETHNHHGDEISTKDMGICYIAKGRNIGITDFILHFNKELTQWSDYKIESNQNETYPF